MDIPSPNDRNEPISLMDPMLISASSTHRRELLDLTIALTEASAGFKHSLPKALVTALANIVRSMNCYYSNLIEGHNTHPVDIEKALANKYSPNATKRNLQLEAKAHITVQQWIDEGGLLGQATTSKALCEIHKRFTELLPDELQHLQNTEGNKQLKVYPGQLRQNDVKVGHHIAISPGAIPRFLNRFEQAYSNLGKAETIISAAAAHHRLLWIHPFLDGNGRVARLMSYATLLETLDTGGLWSVARGLARQVDNYKLLLANCDLTRRNDLDGRGNLSEEALIEFTKFFLEVCLDQVNFMKELVQPKHLRNRVLLWVEEEIRLGNLPAKTNQVLTALLAEGELPRGQVASILDVGDRQARRIVAALAEEKVIVSSSSRAPLRIAFPAKLVGRWLPGLFPQTEH